MMGSQEFLPLPAMGRWKNFAGSAALAEVCGLRALLVHSFIEQKLPTGF